MKRAWMIAAILVALTVGAVAVAEARGPRGGGMMGGGACTGQNYDPAAMAANAEAMLAQHKAFLTTLKAQLDAATNENTKAILSVRYERQQIQTARLEARIPVIQALPADWLQGAIALAKADVTFYSSATAVDAANQTWIAGQLARAQQHLAYLEAEAAPKNN